MLIFVPVRFQEMNFNIFQVVTINNRTHFQILCIIQERVLNRTSFSRSISTQARSKIKISRCRRTSRAGICSALGRWWIIIMPTRSRRGPDLLKSSRNPQMFRKQDTKSSCKWDETTGVCRAISACLSRNKCRRLLRKSGSPVGGLQQVRCKIILLLRETLISTMLRYIATLSLGE